MIQYNDLSIGMEVEAQAENGFWVLAVVCAISADTDFTLANVRMMYRDGSTRTRSMALCELRLKAGGRVAKAKRPETTETA